MFGFPEYIPYILAEHEHDIVKKGGGVKEYIRQKESKGVNIFIVNMTTDPPRWGMSPAPTATVLSEPIQISIRGTRYSPFKDLRTTSECF